LAVELLNGGETPLWDELEGLIVLEQQLGPPGAMDAVVVTRNAGLQRGATAQLLGGLYRGLASAGRPAVAVEAGGQAGENPRLRRYFSSSVDNIDAPTGRVSLVVLLSGSERGHYGLDGDDGYLPPVAPLQRR